jgi:hypothetical protein
MKLQTLFIAIALSSFVGCSTDTVGSNDVNPGSIHQDYSLNYTESSNTSQLSAQFRVGGSSGTTVELEPPALIYVNGQTLKKNTFFGTSYSASVGGAIASANFEYIDNNGLRYMNSVPLKVLTTTLNSAPIMLGTNYYVPVSTFPLEPGDSLHATVEQEFVQNGTQKFIYIDGQFEAANSRFVFSAYDLNRLQNGIVKLHLRRSHRAPLAQAAPRGGGEISSHYSMRPISLTVYGQSFAAIPLLSL